LRRFFARFVAFLKDTRAQASIEYILIAGAVIVAAIIFIPIYRELARETGERANESVVLAGEVTQKGVNREIANL